MVISNISGLAVMAAILLYMLCWGTHYVNCELSKEELSDDFWTYFAKAINTITSIAVGYILIMAVGWFVCSFASSGVGFFFGGFVIVYFFVGALMYTILAKIDDSTGIGPTFFLHSPVLRVWQVASAMTIMGAASIMSTTNKVGVNNNVLLICYIILSALVILRAIFKTDDIDGDLFPSDSYNTGYSFIAMPALAISMSVETFNEMAQAKLWDSFAMMAIVICLGLLLEIIAYWRGVTREGDKPF